MAERFYSNAAGFPKGSKIEDWSKTSSRKDDNLDDTIKGIDKQINADIAGAEKHKSKNKY